MTTLSGHRVSTGVSYYARDELDIDLATAGFAASSSFTITLQVTYWGCSTQVGFNVYLMRPLPSTEHCFAWGPITPSSDPLATLTYGPATVGSGIEWTGSAGATGCTDFTRLHIEMFPYSYPDLCNIEWDWSITYTGTGGTVGMCAYGTQRKAGVTEAIQLSAAAIAGLGLATGELWAIPILMGLGGSVIVIDQICSTLKPTDQTIDLADWSTTASSGVGTVAYQKVISNFMNKLWDAYCECKPAPSGSPSPVSPPVTVLTQPTYLTTYNNIQINNTEISTTINDLWQYFLSINIGNQTNTQIGQQTMDCSCTNLKLGAAHEGLTGEGVITVSGIHGLSVTYTTLPDRIGVAIGDPDTIYTGAWLNVGNAWGWQPRLFPNTTQWMVFPPDMHQMTQVGYSVPEDVVLTIAELVQA